MAALRVLFAAGAVAPAFCSLGCEKPAHYTTKVEIVQVQKLGSQDPAAGPRMMDLELKFVECPGDARKVVRGDKNFGQCGAKFQKGDQLPVELVVNYSYERGQYRDEVVRIGDCPIKVDPKEDANYEVIQDCKDLLATGAVVGVRCDRTRSKDLLAKCPWFRRR
jgi:hypothetical protein